jgi:rhamnose utilization protein RhaD (predicted bifunctional aldolase and dehydrogenase)
MRMPDEFPAFRALSARLGQDPLQVQGPGGNTSIKQDGVMWIKASGTELADALTRDIFVAVDRARAIAEARGEAGDGSCKSTVLDPAQTLRPSIETTFHAALDWPVVAHTHSVATIAHAITPQGCAAALGKLADLNPVLVPYAKPGLPLTREIMARAQPLTRVFLLQNHGLIVCGQDVAHTSALIDVVENRLHLLAHALDTVPPAILPPAGFEWVPEGAFARSPELARLALAGSYYPDHVVFLGPALPVADHAGKPPAVLVAGLGVALRIGATPAQRAMLRCLGDVLSRLPKGVQPDPIGPEAEAELLDWDAEKYRQALAARG